MTAEPDRPRKNGQARRLRGFRIAALTFPAMEFSSNDHIPPKGW